jgi:hypothetical protein
MDTACVVWEVRNELLYTNHRRPCCTTQSGFSAQRGLEHGSAEELAVTQPAITTTSCEMVQDVYIGYNTKIMHLTISVIAESYVVTPSTIRTTQMFQNLSYTNGIYLPCSCPRKQLHDLCCSVSYWAQKQDRWCESQPVFSTKAHYTRLSVLRKRCLSCKHCHFIGLDLVSQKACKKIYAPPLPSLST